MSGLKGGERRVGAEQRQPNTLDALHALRSRYTLRSLRTYGTDGSLESDLTLYALRANGSNLTLNSLNALRPLGADRPNLTLRTL